VAAEAKEIDWQRLNEALRIRVTPYMPHVPHEKQHAFLWLDCFEALYGGAAGGGKSDALLLAALQYVDIPNYSAILFRKTYADLKLPGSLIPRSHEWLTQTDAKWNDNDKQWAFPSGATLNFGYMQTDEDRFRYQSSEFQFIGFDELTQFSRLQYTYMVSRLRRPDGLATNHPLAKVPLRLRGATNPGGRGHLWVKRRFIDRTDDPPEDYTQRIFIPAKLADNPSVDQKAYTYALMQLDDATRAQLLEGDWDAREPGTWVIPDHTWIDAAEALGREMWEQGVPPPPGHRWHLGIDWGENTQAYVIWELPGGGVFIPPSEIIGKHEDPAAVAERILDKTARHQWRIYSARYDAAGIQSMRTFMATARNRSGFERMRSVKIPFAKYKREALLYERILFRRTAMGARTRVIAIHPSNEELIRQLRGWQFKPSKLAEESTDDIEKADDHGPDAILAGIAPLAVKHRAWVEQLMAKAKGEISED
jgi:Terminase large subunit, T4likevirus-type, N-terminal